MSSAATERHCPDPATHGPQYVTPFHRPTIHLVSFKDAGSAGSLCGRSWPLEDVGLSPEKPRGTLCADCCRRFQARSAT